MEKYAVKTGGGENHRFGLFDAFMIKDNHIAACNNFDEISNMIKIARKKYSDKKIEIEVKSIDEVKKALRESLSKLSSQDEKKEGEN